MTHVPHELADELPENKDRIFELKTTDAHFARLFDSDHDVDREIHRAEAAGLNITDDHQEELQPERLSLKDERLEMLRV